MFMLQSASKTELALECPNFLILKNIFNFPLNQAKNLVYPNLKLHNLYRHNKLTTLDCILPIYVHTRLDFERNVCVETTLIVLVRL